MLPPTPPRANFPHQVPQRAGSSQWRRTIARPQLWLSGLGLVGLGLLAWQFSQRPDWQQAMFSRPAESPSEVDAKENQAIGADIDSSALLNSDLRSKPTGLLDTKLNSNDPLAKLKAANKVTDLATANPLSLETLLGGIPGSSSTGLGGAKLGASTSLGSIGGFTTSSGLTSSLNGSTNLANRTTTGSNSLLDSALNRYSPARTNPAAPFAVSPSEPTPSARPPVTPIAGTSGFASTPVPAAPGSPVAGTSAVNPALLSNPDTGLNSYTGLTTSGTLPDSAPNPYASPSNNPGVAAPSAILRSPTSIPVAPGSTPLPPGTSLSIPIAVPAPVPEPPFSVPRSTPGRSIGGGAIGTFSNP
jgi:hypothetical protein